MMYDSLTLTTATGLVLLAYNDIEIDYVVQSAFIYLIGTDLKDVAGLIYIVLFANAAHSAVSQQLKSETLF